MRPLLDSARAIWRFFRAPRTVLSILLFHAAYAAGAIWLKWLDFSSPVFLLATLLLFISTAVCTIERTLLNVRLTRGLLRTYGVPLPPRPGHSARSFLQSQGFRGEGMALFRYRYALWGGWVLHAGMLVLIAGVLVQRSLHDSGGFELTEGERTRLAETPIVARDRGVLAPRRPPDVEVTLLAFDPFYHQHGYAPDRASRVVIGGREAFVDRAAGISAHGVTIYQAIPTSLAINISAPSIGVRSIHLHRDSSRAASAEVTDSAGNCMRFVAHSERPLDDPAGTGRLEIHVDGKKGRQEVAAGGRIAFGGETAEVLSIARWAGFTYSRSPGIPMVFFGFAAILLGSALLAVPAGVAQLTDDGRAAAWVYTRHADVLVEEWNAAGDGGLASIENPIALTVFPGSRYA